jgi:phage terminase large subunit GpA-like protein
MNPAEGQERLIHLPADADEMLVRHLQSEHEIVIRVRGSADVRKKWVTRKGYAANHLLDSTVYAFAIAHAVKVFRLADDAPLYGVIKQQDTGTAGQAEQPTAQQVKRPPIAPRKSYLPLAHNYLRKR